MKKILSVFTLAALVLSFGLMVHSASAQSAMFPAGCSSALGYSVTTGAPCNGTSSATVGPLAGCSTALGYSTITGAPCSGNSFAIAYLAGCSSIYGYSTVTSQPCNGTTVASTNPGTVPPVVITNPGLPTTGAGGNAGELMLALLATGTIAVLGARYFLYNKKNA